MARRFARWLTAIVALTLAVGAIALAHGDGARTGEADTVRVGIYALAPARGDPFRTVGAPGLYIWSSVFDALTQIGPDGAPRPSLATGWAREGERRWRFPIRPGIRFADGRPLTAQAVADSIAIVRGPSYASTQVGALLASVTAVRAEGNAVVIETSKPNAALPSELAGIFIVPAHAWKQLGPDRFAGEAFGTGPFRMTSWAPSRVDLVANPQSWRRAKSKSLAFLELPEEAARISALASGGIDIAIHVSPEAIAQVEGLGARIVRWPAPIMLSLAFDMRKSGSPFRDARVRQAFNYAVNKAAIARYVMNGQTRPASQPATPAALGFDPDITAYPHDPAKARALLQAAGYDFSQRLIVDIAVNAIPADLVVYSAAANDLRRVGVDVEIRALPVATWMRRLSRMEFESPLFGLGLASLPRLDAINAVRPVTCGRNPKPAFTCVPRLDPLVAAVDAEGDPARRTALMRTLMKAAHDEAVVLFLVNSVDFVAAMPTVRGFVPTTRFIHWENVHKGEVHDRIV